MLCRYIDYVFQKSNIICQDYSLILVIKKAPTILIDAVKQI